MTTIETVRAHSAVRRAADSEAAPIAAVLGRAFLDDPVMRWTVPDDDRRRRVLPAFFELFADRFLAWGEVRVAGGAAGAALWAPPGHQVVDDDNAEEFARRMEEILGPDAGRAAEIAAVLEEPHPQEAHYYLQFLGVDPDRQGLGIGSALLAPALRDGDRTGTPAYLDATSPRNRRLYERHGFRVIAEVAPAGGPPLWPMWRTPQSG